MSHKIIALLTVLVGIYVFPLSSLFGTTTDKNSVTLSKSNVLVLSSEINGDTASTLMQQAKSLQANGFSKSKPIYLFVNSPGGDVEVGLELIEDLSGLGRPVNTVTLFGASMAFQLVQALGERLILKNGTLMSHRARGAFEGFFGGKTGSQLDSRYGFWLGKLQELDEQTVKRSNGKQTLESYQKAYADELWLTGQQSVAGGYADRIVTVHCDNSLGGVTTHTVDFLGAKILYDLDNCPINTNPMNVRVSLPEEKGIDSAERASEVRAKFTEQYVTKQRSVIPMTW